jgi:hypothetical protein
MSARTAQDFYVQTVQELPLTERLRLAALILGDLAQPNVSILETSDVWCQEDEREVANFSLRYAATRFPDNEELV